MKQIIKKLAKEMNAIILAHNYQPPEIQNIADMCGDSLELSIKAANTNYDIIVFCGVKFMAETASILSPNKTILLPEPKASCAMVNMIQVKELKKYLNNNPNIPVVSYINTSAEVKALSTICCTSANSTKIVNSLKEDKILMIPDYNLAKNTEKLTKKIIQKWNGYCPIHNNITPEIVKKAMTKHPKAILITHPECPEEVTKLANICLSTSGMMKYVSQSKEKEFIIGTENGIIFPMRKKNPDKIFYPLTNKIICSDMKTITLKHILNSLQKMEKIIKVPKNIRTKALRALNRMLQLSK